MNKNDWDNHEWGLKNDAIASLNIKCVNYVPKWEYLNLPIELFLAITFLVIMNE